ncbi:MAG: hypothetical protein OQK57_02210, partial [Ignavibacteriaceae bacterium]|nr:hypothetical protein [Ignavibacteriaceae bacterium]
NAALAALTVSKTFLFNDGKKYLNGIENVAKNTGLQGRYEYFQKNPSIIFDSAHNPEGIENFLVEFVKEAGSYEKRTLIFGAMRDKAITDMLQMLSKYFDEILVTEIKYERAAPAKEILQLCFNLNINAREITEPADFVESFKSRNSNECLVVLGSMYLLGEIKQQLKIGVA